MLFNATLAQLHSWCTGRPCSSTLQFSNTTGFPQIQQQRAPPRIENISIGNLTRVAEGFMEWFDITFARPLCPYFCHI
jgi:hypothetical protein